MIKILLSRYGVRFYKLGTYIEMLTMSMYRYCSHIAPKYEQNLTLFTK